MKIQVIMALGALLLIWPSGFPAVATAVQVYTPLEMATCRMGIAALLMALVGLVFRIRLPQKRDLLPNIVCGVIGLALYNILLGYGQQMITSAQASFIVSLTPIFIVIAAALFLKESIGWKTTSGILISFSGVAYMSLSKGDVTALNLGSLFVLGGAMTQAILTLTQKRLLERYTPLELSVYSTVAAGLSLLPIGFPVFAKAAADPTSPAVLSMIYLASVPSFGYLIWCYILKYLSAAKTASFLYALPVSTSLLAWVLIDEVPGWSTMIGGAVSLIGVAIVNIRRQQKHKFTKPVKPGASI